MSETTYIIDLTPDGKNRYRHRHVLERKKIVEFLVQYEPYIEGAWYAIVRYDTVHGFAHRDIIHADGTEAKTAFQNWDYAQVLTYGERDLKQNWLSYRQRYEKELESMKKKRSKQS